jgi:hypothetical protein
MQEVSTCDFCDGSAVGAFEVLPASIGGEKPRRMVLCGSCETTLIDTIDPLLAMFEEMSDQVISDAEPLGEAEPPNDGSATNSSTGDGSTGDTSASDGDSKVMPVEAGEGETKDQSNTDHRPNQTRSRTPKGYSKVMRFLEGREFPMERNTAEAMVAETYEMDAERVTAAVDHAAKHGRLRVASGKLFN